MIRDIRVYPAIASDGEQTIKVKLITDARAYEVSLPSFSHTKAKAFSEAKRILSWIRSTLVGLDETDWITNDHLIEQIDDGFSKVGINFAFALSITMARASTENDLWRLEGPKQKYVFPIPCVSVISGKPYGGRAEWSKFYFIPDKAKNPFESIHIVKEAYDILGEELIRRKWIRGKANDNSFITKLNDLQTLDLLSSIAEDYGISLGIDFAASRIYKKGFYVYSSMKKKLSREKQIDAVKDVAKVYGIRYLEDPFEHNDFEAFAELKKSLQRSLLAGDKLYLSDVKRVIKGINTKSTDIVCFTPEIMGDLKNVFKLVKLCRKNDISLVISERPSSGDWFEVDLSIAWSFPILKLPAFPLDVTKYSRLLEVWDEVHEKAMASL